MATTAKIYDVFVSHSSAERETAEVIAKSLEAAGLTTFHLGSVEHSDKLSEAVWEALADSFAVIALVSPEFRDSANVMLEIGAASAWNKPIYVIVKEPESAFPNGVLRKYPAYPLSRLDDVIAAIKAGMEPLTEEERGVLTDIYAKIAVPADLLSQSSKSLGEISQEFRQRTKKAYPGERLLYELLRLRKRGGLPRLSAVQH
jgi:hypothetical protein